MKALLVAVALCLALTPALAAAPQGAASCPLIDFNRPFPLWVDLNCLPAAAGPAPPATASPWA